MMRALYATRIAILITLLWSTVAVAESSSARCAKGEWLVDVAAGSNKGRRAEAAIEQASDKDVVATDGNSHFTLFEDKRVLKEERASGGPDQIVAARSANSLCRELEEERRQAILEFRRTGRLDVTAARDYNCECNYELTATATPNDPLFTMTWGLNDSLSSYSINAQSAWNTEQGSKATVAAVIDTGVDFNHPDLTANMWRNPGEILGNGMDDDGNGVVDDVYGYNAINNSGGPWDDQGHGTHVAGTIGGSGNNAKGVAGVNWNVSVMAVKFLNSSGNGALSDAVKGLDYVTKMRKDYGVNVVVTNNSWGCACGYIQSLADSFERARSAGIVNIAAAGNSANNNDGATKFYPSSYSNLISVAATTTDGGLAYFSNYGATSVHIGAPGSQISSTYPNDRYVYLSGTSMASPHVAGAVALLRSHNYQLTEQQARSTILNSARPIPGLQGKVSTNGLLDINAALAMWPQNRVPDNYSPSPGQPNPTPTGSPTPLPSPSVTLTVSGTVSDAYGVAIGGAKVTVSNQYGEWIAYSSASGYFEVSGVRGPINSSMTAEKAGYIFGTRSAYLSANYSVVFVASVKTYNVIAQVIDTYGRPVFGVTVDAGELGTFYTNASGQVGLLVGLGKSYTLNFSKSGFIFPNNGLRGTVLGDVTRQSTALAD